MPPRRRTWLRLVHGSYAFVYLLSVVAGVCGLLEPTTGQVYDLYGKSGNIALIIVTIVSGALGLWAYLTRRWRLELLGAPLLCTALVFIAPALFVSDMRSRETAWYGWLMIGLGVCLIARWADVRSLLERQARARRRFHQDKGQHRLGGNVG